MSNRLRAGLLKFFGCQIVERSIHGAGLIVLLHWIRHGRCPAGYGVQYGVGKAVEGVTCDMSHLTAPQAVAALDYWFLPDTGDEANNKTILTAVDRRLRGGTEAAFVAEVGAFLSEAQMALFSTVRNAGSAPSSSPSASNSSTYLLSLSAASHASVTRTWTSTSSGSSSNDARVCLLLREYPRGAPRAIR